MFYLPKGDYGSKPSGRAEIYEDLRECAARGYAPMPAVASLTVGIVTASNRPRR